MKSSFSFFFFHFRFISLLIHTFITSKQACYLKPMFLNFINDESRRFEPKGTLTLSRALTKNVFAIVCCITVLMLYLALCVCLQYGMVSTRWQYISCTIALICKRRFYPRTGNVFLQHLI